MQWGPLPLPILEKDAFMVLSQVAESIKSPAWHMLSSWCLQIQRAGWTHSLVFEAHWDFDLVGMTVAKTH